MTPFSFEWQWNADYLIFMGLLYLALLIIGGGLTFVWVKTWFDLDIGEGPEAPPPEISYRSKYGEF